MRKALVKVRDEAAAVLEENAGRYTLTYFDGYSGGPVSLALPPRDEPYPFDRFPAFFDGLLPEGWMLEATLCGLKVERGDYMGQLLSLGGNTVGDVTVETMT